ncbi:MAG: ATPase, T2SS/T4P/T4SS family [Candidatus Bathyarchaeia archaeon]
MRIVSAEFDGKVLAKYNVGACTVFIINDGRKTRYCLQEPLLTKDDVGILDQMIKNFVYTGEILSREGVEQFIWKTAEKTRKLEYFSQNFHKIKYYIVRETIGYSVLQPLLDDPNVSEIICPSVGAKLLVSCSVADEPVIETNISLTEDDFMLIARKFAAKVKAENSNLNIVKGVTEEEYYVYILRNPMFSIGSFTIKKFREATISQLLREKVVDVKTAAVIKTLLHFGENILVVGEKKSGKTTVMSTLINMIDSSKKIVLVENVPEIKAPDTVIRIVEEKNFEDYVLFVKPAYIFADNVNVDVYRMNVAGISCVLSCEKIPDWYKGYIIQTIRRGGYTVKVYRKNGQMEEVKEIDPSSPFYPYYLEEMKKLASSLKEGV